MIRHLVRPVTLGLAAGMVSGMFGVGGGVIIVPGLVLWMSLDQRTASGTSTATIVATSATAGLFFSAEGQVDWPAAAWIFVGAGIGAVFGARMLDRIPERWLATAFATMMGVAAVRLYL